MKQKYYVNNKQVNYTIFSAYLKQAIRHNLLQYYINNNISYTYDKLNKDSIDLKYQYYNEMKYQNVTMEIDKVVFKVCI